MFFDHLLRDAHAKARRAVRGGLATRPGQGSVVDMPHPMFVSFVLILNSDKFRQYTPQQNGVSGRRKSFVHNVCVVG